MTATWLRAAPIPPACDSRGPRGIVRFRSVRSWSSINEAFLNFAVRVDTAVAEKWPVRALRVERAEIGLDDQRLLLAHRSFCHDLPRRIGDKTLPPKLDPIAAVGRLVSHAIRHRDVAAV